VYLAIPLVTKVDGGLVTPQLAVDVGDLVGLRDGSSRQRGKSPYGDHNL